MPRTGRSATNGSFKAGHKSRGGRPKGSRDKFSERLSKALAEEGYDPQSLVRLGFEIARDQATSVAERVHAIGTVLPYMLPKRAAIEMSGDGTRPPMRIRVVIDDGKTEEGAGK